MIWLKGFLNSSGVFYGYVKKKHALSAALPVQAPSTDHSIYNASTPLVSFKKFCVRVEENSFCLFDFLKNLRVTSVDIERLTKTDKKVFSCQTDKKFSSVQHVSSQPPPKRILEEKHGFAERVNGAIL